MADATKRAKSKSAEAETIEKPLIDEILDKAKPIHLKKQLEIPEGFQLLEGGKTREIGVNQEFIKGRSNKPWFIYDGEKDKYGDDVQNLYMEVRFVEEAQTATGTELEYVGCGATHQKNTCRLVTRGPVLVRK